MASKVTRRLEMLSANAPKRAPASVYFPDHAIGPTRRDMLVAPFIAALPLALLDATARAGHIFGRDDGHTCPPSQTSPPGWFAFCGSVLSAYVDAPIAGRRMRANLRNQARQTHLPRWKPLLPVFEAVMNSFQAIEDVGPSPAHKITITIGREPDLLSTTQAQITSFTISDTGVGFNKENFDAFNELFSERKLPQGGKGVGRTLWLKAFSRIEIDSTFADPEKD